MSKTSVRDRIIRSARSMILAKGYSNISLRAVASAAGVTTGAIYSNFGSKADLVGAAVMDAIERMGELFGNGLDGPADKEQLGLLLRRFFAYISEHSDMYQLVREAYNDREIWNTLSAEHHDRLIMARSQFFDGITLAMLNELPWLCGDLFAGRSLIAVLSVLFSPNMTKTCRAFGLEEQSVRRMALHWLSLDRFSGAILDSSPSPPLQKRSSPDAPSLSQR